MIKWTHIILHHSLTEDSQTVSWNAIRKYHLSKGWYDIGYHAGIELVGDEYVIMAGRPLNMQGAHTKGMNDKALGFCFVGNYDLTSPPAAMLVKAAAYIKGWEDELNIFPENIHGHRDYANKTCPGSQFDIPMFVELLR